MSRTPCGTWPAPATVRSPSPERGRAGLIVLRAEATLRLLLLHPPGAFMKYQAEIVNVGDATTALFRRCVQKVRSRSSLLSTAVNRSSSSKWATPKSAINRRSVRWSYSTFSGFTSRCTTFRSRTRNAREHVEKESIVRRPKLSSLENAYSSTQWHGRDQEPSPRTRRRTVPSPCRQCRCTSARSFELAELIGIEPTTS